MHFSLEIYFWIKNFIAQIISNIWSSRIIFPDNK